jgi:hypothetical protein
VNWFDAALAGDASVTQAAAIVAANNHRVTTDDFIDDAPSRDSRSRFET